MQNSTLKIISKFKIFIKFQNILKSSFSTKSSDITFPPIDLDNLYTMNDVKTDILRRMGLSEFYTPSPEPRDNLLQYEPKHEELPPRTIQDSFVSAVIPLRQDSLLQRHYISSNGVNTRIGRLLEDMDLFASWICHKHLHIPNLDSEIPLPYTFVTILVDEMKFTTYRPKYNLDIILSGHVSWVSRSSLEITVWLEQTDNDNICHPISKGLFLMAARNAINTCAAPVNPLILNNDYEQKIFDDGSSRKEIRFNEYKTLPLYVEPNEDEKKIIHDLFMKTMNKNTLTLYQHDLPESYKWIHETQIIATTPCYADKLNVQNTVFGGYLMRLAIETSLICAHRFCGEYPFLSEVTKIIFRKPIYVPSYIQMSTHAICAKDNRIQILTTADIFQFHPSKDNYKIRTETSNIFQCIFDTKDHKMKKLIPKTYKEAMWYLEGRRKLLKIT